MKKWYLSRTLWVNLIAIVAIVLQSVTGNEVLEPEIQGSILAIINMLLRIITKHQLTA